MSVTHATVLRSIYADAMTSSLGSSAKLVFKSDSGAVCATLPMFSPAFGPAVNGVALANPITNDSNAAGGIVSRAELQTGTGSAMVFCSVTGPGGGGDIEIDELLIQIGQTVSVSSFSYTAPV